MLVTNYFKLAACTIVAIYMQRRQIELFFKLLKQQLKIKTFVGTSANAAHIQIWTAVKSDVGRIWGRAYMNGRVIFAAREHREHECANAIRPLVQ
jgi:Transposase DDE domain